MGLWACRHLASVHLRRSTRMASGATAIINAVEAAAAARAIGCHDGNGRMQRMREMKPVVYSTVKLPVVRLSCAFSHPWGVQVGCFAGSFGLRRDLQREFSLKREERAWWKFGSDGHQGVMTQKKAGNKGRSGFHVSAVVDLLELKDCPSTTTTSGTSTTHQLQVGAVADVVSKTTCWRPLDSNPDGRVESGDVKNGQEEAAANDDQEGNEENYSHAGIISAVENCLGGPLGTGPQAPSPSPLIIIISGPSGVGKDAVIKKLQDLRKDLHFVVTATSRPMRVGEVDGEDYFFVSKEEFVSMIEGDELLEHAIVYGDYKGIPKKQVRELIDGGKDVVLRVDVQGAATVRSIVNSGAVFIFLVAESEAALVNRLVSRKTEPVDKILIRISKAREEARRMNEFDYVVVNADGQLDQAVDRICSIIDAEKAKVHQRQTIL